MRLVVSRQVVSAAVIATALVVLPGLASAQSNPSVQQAIDALKPKPGKSRGSRPVTAGPSTDAAPAPVAAAPAAAAPQAAPAAPRQVAAAPAPKPAADADAPAINFNILFASGSADLTPSATKALDTLGQALSSADLSASRFRIEGHTDTVGSADSNRALSARRAEAVVDFLSSKYRIGRDRLEAVGMGQDKLEVPTGDQVNEPRNRRVRVVNITG